MKFPSVLAYDVAGEVFAVGSGVTKSKWGDRIDGLTSTAFQNYTIVKEYLTVALPRSIKFEEASVIPLGFSVAVKGLFHRDYLAFDLPAACKASTNKAAFIWGGSTSVGSNAV